MSFAAVAFGLSWLLLVEAGLMLLTGAIALALGETSVALACLAGAVLGGFAGGGLALATRGIGGDFGKYEAYLLTVLAWPVLAGFGALPLLLTPAGIGVVDALFSSLSALTTTGAWVLPGPSTLPRGLLIWFALLHWGGGLLTIVLIVALMSHLGIGGLNMFRSALPRGEGLSPLSRLGHTARDLGLVYAGLTAVGVLAVWLAGMSAFHAFCHGLGAISTGGFSSIDGGVQLIDNWQIETVLMVLMLIGALNFTTVWAVASGRGHELRTDPELRYLGAVALVVALLVLASVIDEGWSGVGARAHAALFAAISAISTTGYAVQSPSLWHAQAPVLLIALLLLGGCTGSTTGGIKLMRLAMLFKQSSRELARLSHPHGVVPMRFAGQRITETTLGSVWSFFFFGLLSLVGLALGLALAGLTPLLALSGAVASISNAGPALGLMAPYEAGYGEWPDAAKGVYALGMWLGRVEILTLLTMLNPAYWRH
ncbi:MAG: potassium transporter TrkG [Alphaproteobacteria bacterium]